MKIEQSTSIESCSALNDTDYSVVLKRKCREIEQSSPSMMWKRSIVQARSYAHGTAALALLLAVLGCTCTVARCADLVIEIPGSVGGDGQPDGGQYRLDYRPPDGTPAPNFTVAAGASTISFQGLPGTKYHFMLYYSNATFADLLTWNQTIITAPEPPTNLTVTLGRNKQATISWSPPEKGEYTGFRFKVIPLTERAEGGGARNITVEESGNWTQQLRDLSPGATYQLHAFTLLHDKESAAYASRNFTTKPNTPGKFIVWFRNETTLLVLWQPPYPPGAYTHYKVSIEPPDARDSELYVEKEGEPPGPAQAAFKGLVPGRAYNISVQTVSEPEISAPTTAQYRTVPLRPRNVSVPRADLTETSFRVTWLPPIEESEFEKYQVSVMGAGGGARRLAPVLRGRDEAPACTFDALEPGAPYSVTVKTMSGKVTSWPATTELTLKPLPVQKLTCQPVNGSEGIIVSWVPAANSTQDEYKVSYQESGESRDESSALSSTDTSLALTSLLPGRNYTITVSAVSRGVQSNETSLPARTRPLAPVLLAARPGAGALQLAWRSDVTSRQERYQLRYRRPPAGDYRTLETAETSATLDKLFPGAVYEIQLAAVSYGLLSERHTIWKPVRPVRAVSLNVTAAATMRGALVTWEGPPSAASALGGYVLQYQPTDDNLPEHRELLPPTAHSQEITNLTPGERYVITLDTVSEDANGETVESEHPLTFPHFVRPRPVSNVLSLADAHNVSLEWPAAGGRVDAYSVAWAPLEPGCGEGGELAAAAPRASLGRLLPGCNYRVDIAALSYNLSSDVFTMETRTRPLIQSEIQIVIENGNGDDEDAQSTTLKVLYTPTPATASRFDSYRFRLEGRGEVARWQTRAAAAERDPVVFLDLVPGRLYNLTMWTVSGNVTSHPVQRQSRLYPRPITVLNATEISAREVTLSWDRPRGDYTEFQVQYLASLDQLQTRSTTQLRLTVEGLRPHRNYTFSVVVVAGGGGTLRSESRTRSVEVVTLEAPPLPPEQLELVDASPSSATLSWRLGPERANGQLLGFVLRYAPRDHPDLLQTLEFPPDARGGTVAGLAAGGTYAVRLAARTGAGEGGAARLTLHTPIGPPPRPAPHLLPREAARSPTTVAVRFAADYFSAANGNVTAYTLVLAEEPRNDTPARLPSWRDVHALPAWPPYQVTEPYYPFHTSAVEEFTIGSERCDAGGRAYCNGPLKPGTRYYVKLRAFTAPDKFADTDYTVVHTEVDNTAWIVGACVAGVLLAGGTALLLLLRRRAALPPAAPLAPRASRPVRVADFIDHYRLMSADSDFRFSEEFEELKHVGREQPCTAADLPVNRPKNRFTNILPYDHSRYKLQPVDDEEGSDYINANYVPGFNSPREFIVTQGPLHCTRDDFWRMVWESGSRAIVMLTRCVEKGREKCDRYWPFDTRPVYYGDISVTALNESRYADWTVSELGVARGPEQRVVAHFHFTTWPDFGVPEPPTTLARFVRAFRERVAADGRPVVVHCSAGVGRSGTFVTLDTALRQLAAGADALDVFGMVHALRRERVFMVQTEQQYICVHQCLVAALEGRDLAPPHPHTHHHNQAFEDDEGIAESGM